MEQIKDLVQQRKNIILEGFDPINKSGFVQLPKVVLRNSKLSGTAKLCYAMLLYYAWQEERCFPGQAKLARHMGTSRPTVIKSLKELEKAGYLKQVRRGQGWTNLYHLYCRVNFQK